MRETPHAHEAGKFGNTGRTVRWDDSDCEQGKVSETTVRHVSKEGEAEQRIRVGVSPTITTIMNQPSCERNVWESFRRTEWTVKQNMSARQMKKRRELGMELYQPSPPQKRPQRPLLREGFC